MDLESTEIIKLLPGEIVGYAALALLILYIAKKMYGEQLKDNRMQLEDTRIRLGQNESSLAAITQEHHQKIVELADARAELKVVQERLTSAQDSEGRCAQRMSRLEARYEARIGELEDEISILRTRLGEVSESYIDGGS